MISLPDISKSCKYWIVISSPTAKTTSVPVGLGVIELVREGVCVEVSVGWVVTVSVLVGLTAVEAGIAVNFVVGARATDWVVLILLSSATLHPTVKTISTSITRAK
jgi:hypothetical protein